MQSALFAVFLLSAIRLAMPLLLAATGDFVSERAGVLNMSLEGLMLTGAFAGATASWASGSPMIDLGVAVLATLPVALLQALLTVKLRANQIVSGLGINILVLGATTLAYWEIFGARSRDAIPGFERWIPPGLGRIPVSARPSSRRTGSSTLRRSSSSPSFWPCASPFSASRSMRRARTRA